MRYITLGCTLLTYLRPFGIYVSVRLMTQSLLILRRKGVKKKRNFYFKRSPDVKNLSITSALSVNMSVVVLSLL